MPLTRKFGLGERVTANGAADGYIEVQFILKAH